MADAADLTLGERIEAAYGLVNDGEKARAVDAFVRIRADFPDHPAGWRGLLNIASSQSDWAEVDALTQECATRFPDADWWELAVAASRESRSQFLEAEAAFSSAFAKSSQSSIPAFRGIVRSIAADGRWSDVISFCSRHDAQLTADPGVRMYLAFAYELTGADDKALLVFSQQLETDGNTRWALLGQSRMSYKRFELDAAEEYARRAIAIDDALEAHLQLGAVYVMRSTASVLRTEYFDRLDVDQDDVIALQMIQRLSVWIEDWTTAISFGERCLAREDDPVIASEVGLAQLRLKRYDDATATFDVLSAEHPELPLGLVGHGRVAAVRFELARAADVFAEVWRKFPDSWSYVEEVSNALLEASRYEEAQAVLVDAGDRIEGAGKSSALDFLRVHQLVTQFEFDAALEILERVVEEAADVLVRQSALSKIIEYTSRSQSHPDKLAWSVALLEQEDFFPLSSSLNLTLGYIALGRFDDALAMLDRLPDDQRRLWYTQRLLAWQATQQGDHALACKYADNWLSGMYVPQIEAEIVNLELVRKPLEIIDGEVVVFSAARDEYLRLPAFLDHHRRMGVRVFVMIDNGSTDGTYEFLLAQPDVILYRTDDDYVNAGLGMRWINHLIEDLETSNWCLFLDADELLVFPDFERLGITHLLDYLNRKGHTAVGSYMLDMHPASLNAQDGLEPGDDLIAHSPFLTNTYNFQPFPLSPYTDVRGGFRPTVLGEKYRQMTKCPLVHSDAGIKFLASSHETTPSVISDVKTALLHFKFVGDALTRSENEVEWTDYVYYAERNRVLERLRQQQIEEGDVDFMSEHAVRFENSMQLFALGLIDAPADFFESGE